MIEVIKHGKTQKTGTIITKCPECECIFKFELKKDVIHSYFFGYNYVECPDCGERVIVHTAKELESKNPVKKIACDVLDERYFKE